MSSGESWEENVMKKDKEEMRGDGAKPAGGECAQFPHLGHKDAPFPQVKEGESYLRVL